MAKSVISGISAACNKLSRAYVERTQLQNNRRLGVSRRGVKLTERDVRAVRALLAQGYDWYTLGHMYRVSHVAIWQIARGITWRHVA